MPEPGSRTETWSLLGEPEAPQRPPDGYLAKATSLVKLFTKGKLSPHPRQSPLSEHPPRGESARARGHDGMTSRRRDAG